MVPNQPMVVGRHLSFEADLWVGGRPLEGGRDRGARPGPLLERHEQRIRPRLEHTRRPAGSHLVMVMVRVRIRVKVRVRVRVRVGLGLGLDKIR